MHDVYMLTREGYNRNKDTLKFLKKEKKKQPEKI